MSNTGTKYCSQASDSDLRGGGGDGGLLVHTRIIGELDSYGGG